MFARRKLGHDEVDHFMAALIEHLARWFAGGGFVERKEEHAALGAEPFLPARRMPSRGKSFRRKHDPFAARLGDGVAASLFKRAHCLECCELPRLRQQSASIRRATLSPAGSRSRQAQRDLAWLLS